MGDYALDNAWNRTQRRLSLLEQQLDPMTQQRMLKLGVTKGWRCLEVAGGWRRLKAGSVDR